MPSNIFSGGDILESIASSLSTFINPQSAQYGAKGDGSTDDTAALQAAINASSGKTLFIPAGRYVYTNLSLSSLTSTIRVIGEGPERTILAPSASASSPTITADWGAGSSMPNVVFENLSWDLAACPTNDAIYINNVNKLLVTNCKWRQGARQLFLGFVSASMVEKTWHMNFQTAGIYLAPPNPASSGNPSGQQPNIEFDTIHGESTSVNNGVAATAAIWINGFCAGVSMQNIWAIKSTAANTGTWGAGIRIDGPEAPSGVFGHFVLMSAVNTDGIDGPGVRLNNVRQLQYTNSFLGTRSAGASGTDAGLHLFGTCQDIISGGGNWISGQGITVDNAATVSGFQSNGDTFPQTVAGGALVVPSGATISNWLVGPANRYFTAPFVDDATAGRVLLGAPTTVATRPTMTAPKIMTSAANAYERIQFYNPVAALPWFLDITDTGSGWRILDNGARVIFALVNGGGAQVGNQTGTTNAPITIKKVTAQTTSYGGNATLAAGTRDSVAITVTNANMATTDQIEASSSTTLPQGVSLKPVITAATTATVFIENNSAASANVGACTIRTTIIQYANA